MKFLYPELEEELVKEIQEMEPRRLQIAAAFDAWQAESWLKYVEWEKRYEKKLKEEKD